MPRDDHPDHDEASFGFDFGGAAETVGKVLRLALSMQNDPGFGGFEIDLAEAAVTRRAGIVAMVKAAFHTDS